MLKLDEALLEPVARLIRFWRALKYYPQKGNLIVADLGCGPKLRFLKYLVDLNAAPKHYIGVDPLVKNDQQFQETLTKHAKLSTQISLNTSAMKKQIPLGDESVDVVVGFAFLEHIDYPQAIIKDIERVLKPGGKAIITTPTPRAKSLLEWLSYKLLLISRREIAEHKNYFNREILLAMARSTKLKPTHRYFEFGLNNLLVLEKAVLSH